MGSVLLPKPPQFLRAFLQGGGVAINAHSQLERRVVLSGDDLRERAVMFVPQLNVIRDDGLQLFHQPEDNDATTDEQQAERGQEKPAVIHAGGVIHGGDKFVGVHVRHGLATSCTRSISSRRAVKNSAALSVLS